MKQSLSRLFTAVLLCSSGMAVAQTGTAPAAAASPAPSAATAPVRENAETGKAVYYSNVFNGRRTYSKEVFNNSKMVAAHRTLPMGTMVRVVNNQNKKAVTVRIVDRGPSQPDRIIDVSRAAAAQLGFVRAGIADVSLTVVSKAKPASAARGK